jgi:BCD family chlorophyll transporter-like MFS transporter
MTQLSWAGVARLGLVQASIGAVVVLMTSTLNRVMVVELGLAAAIPGALVALHFAVQMFFRPRLGYWSDAGGRRTPVIRMGMGLLAFGGADAVAAVALVTTQRTLGLIAAAVAFVTIGLGVSAAGTPLLALLADRVTAERRGRAAAVVWLMMIAGFVVTTLVVGRLIEPFSFTRLMLVAIGVSVTAFTVSWVALAGLEGDARGAMVMPSAESHSFRSALASAWQDGATRRFAIFVFVAMLAYSAQDLVLEPFAGSVFRLTPGESTQVTSVHQGGMLAGMIITALLSARVGSLPRWAAFGCAASALAFIALAMSPLTGTVAALRWSVLALGLANGTFAIGAIGSMMQRARGRQAGLRMGVFGAAQAVAYAIGSFIGAAGSDVGRAISGSDARGYMAVFAAEAVLFLVAAVLAWDTRAGKRESLVDSREGGDALMASLA